jgi:hypothetical protein
MLHAQRSEAMKRTATVFCLVIMALALTLTIFPTRAQAQSAPETFTATASVKTAAGESKTAPVVISITRWTTEAERTAVGTALKSGAPAFKKALDAMPDAGTIQVGERKTTLKFAFNRPIGSNRLVTVAAAQPILYLGIGASEAKPKAGFDFALATFEVDAAGKGTLGELAPAATVKLDANNAIVVQDYGVEAVRLIGISKK